MTLRDPSVFLVLAIDGREVSRYELNAAEIAEKWKSTSRWMVAYNFPVDGGVGHNTIEARLEVIRTTDPLDPRTLAGR
jgi:hypothetical protein